MPAVMKTMSAPCRAGPAFLAAFLRGHGAALGIAARAQAAAALGPQGQLQVGLALGEALLVGVHGDELHAGDTAVDHAVDGVAARAAHAHAP